MSFVIGKWYKTTDSCYAVKCVGEVGDGRMVFMLASYANPARKEPLLFVNALDVPHQLVGSSVRIKPEEVQHPVPSFQFEVDLEGKHVGAVLCDEFPRVREFFGRRVSISLMCMEPKDVE